MENQISLSSNKFVAVVQSPSCVWLFVIPWTEDRSLPCHPVPHHIPKFAHVHCINEAIQPSHPVVSSSASIVPSIRNFSRLAVQQLSICLNMKSAIQGLKLKAVIHGLYEKQARIRKKIILDNYDLTWL